MRNPKHQSRYGFISTVLLIVVLFSISFTLLLFNATPADRQPRIAGGSVPGPLDALGTLGEKLPLHFEPDRGQLPSGALYRSRGPGYNLLLTSREAVLLLQVPSRSPARTMPTQEALSIALVNANPGVHLIPEQALPGKANYFIGNRPEQWRTDIPLYGKVRYAGVYPGIDLVFYGTQRRLEYDFVVAPGSDPGRIELLLGGAESLELDTQGDLRVGLNSGQVRFRRPEIYQQTDSGRTSISGRFLLRGDQRVAFEVEQYDVTRPLVIDPVLSYSSFLGTAGTDGAHGIAVDAAGNIYVTGIAGGSNFPVVNPFSKWVGSFEAFVSKFNPAGNALVYSTFLGGSNTDAGYAIAVDAQGSASVAGKTSSTNFPLLNPLQTAYAGGGSDAFVTRLSPAGNSLVYSTYLGGSGSEGWVGLASAAEMGIAVHPAGYAFVTGQTASSNFPTANAFRSTLAGGTDAFVAKIGPTGAPLVFSTYLGGGKADQARGIAVDTPGRACVIGETQSDDFPLANPFQAALGGDSDAFVTCVNPAGNGLFYSTYLGGSAADAGSAIALDNPGYAYVTGQTRSSNFPTVTPFQGSLSGEVDAFMAKLNPVGSALAYSTYLGGSSEDYGLGVQVDAAGNPHLTGRTYSADFPLANPFQAALGGAALFKTEDSGARWNGSGVGLNALSIQSLQFDPANPQVIYAGTDRGVFASVSGGKNWYPFNQGLTDVQPPKGSESSLWEVARIAKEPLSSEGMVAPGPVNPLYFIDLRFFPEQRMLLGCTPNRLLMNPLACPGAPWFDITYNLSDYFFMAIVYAILMSPPKGEDVGSLSSIQEAATPSYALYALTSGGVFYGIWDPNALREWTPANTGLPNNVGALAAAIDGTLYAGAVAPLAVYTLPFAGNAWTKVSQTWTGVPLAPFSFLCLAPDPLDARKIYAGTDMGPFRSNDGGANWSFAGKELAYVAVNAMVIDPRNTEIVYAGTRKGVYKSSNGGQAWVAVNSGLPGSNVQAVAMHPVDSKTLIAAGSRGSDAFITQFSAAGNRLLHSSFLGGSADDWGLSIALHETNGAHVGGVTESADFPTVTPFQGAKSEFQEAFIARIVPFPLLNGTLEGSLDTPAKNSTVQGNVALGGWAAVISGKNASIPTRLDLLIDGVRVGTLSSGTPRPDVRQYLAGRGITAPENLGYAGIWNSYGVADGTHQLSIRGTDMAAATAETVAEIAAISIVTNNGIAPATTTLPPATTTTSSTSTTTVRPTTTTTTSSTTTVKPTTTTTSTLPVFYRRYFPKVTADALQNTGLAVVNLSAETANLTFRAYADSGTLLASAQRTLAARAQLALQLAELLPAFGQNRGWLLMESSAPGVEGLFLLYDNAVTTMDGAAVSGTLLRDFIIAGADDAEISLVNPSTVPVSCTLEYVSDSGVAFNARTSIIPAMGRVVLSSAQLRPQGAAGGYLRGSSTGVVPLATFGKAGWLAALPGIDSEGSAASGHRVLYAPQYASGGGYATVLELVNLEASATAVTLRLIGDAGVQLGTTASLTLPARGAARFAEPSAFGLSAGSAPVQGYVRAESVSGRFAGTVRFTDPAQAQFGSALQFTGAGLTQSTFSQVAQNEQYFTGLACLNPNAEPASVTVTVYNTAGITVASGTLTIPAGGRFSKVLTELVGPLSGISRGYFEVRSSVPVAGFALFGTNNGEVLSAIPALSAGAR